MISQLRTILAATTLFAASATAQFTVLSDNLDKLWAGTDITTATNWLCASFGTDAQTYKLVSVEGPYYGGGEVDIYTSVGAGVGQPGTLVGALTPPGIGSPDWTASGIVLSASTTYWVVAKGQSGPVDWHWTVDISGTGVGFQHTWGYSPDAGGSWLTYADSPYLMRVIAEPAVTQWIDLGSGLAGISGIPQLNGTGDLLAGTSGSLSLVNAAPSALAPLFISTSNTPTPFKGGTLLTVPVLLTLLLTTDSTGDILLPWTAWPSGLSGVSLYFQYAIQDSVAVKGAALSNALRADVP